MKSIDELPNTFAGGMFGLNLKVAKVARQGMASDGERQSANRYLEQKGYFLDRAGVLWEKHKVPEFAKDKAEKE